jgi:hypothetical protein
VQQLKSPLLQTAEVSIELKFAPLIRLDFGIKYT